MSHFETIKCDILHTWNINVYFLQKVTILVVKSQRNVVPILAWYKESLKGILGHFQQGGENVTLWDNQMC